MLELRGASQLGQEFKCGMLYFFSFALSLCCFMLLNSVWQVNQSINM